VELVITPGPRADWFTAAAWRALTDRTWAAAVDSDRTATRLEGIPLERRVTGELPSEGLIRGAVQVPPSGLPLIFGADHPVTGGYPVIAVVTEAGCDRAAQLRPGDRVRLRPSPGTAAPRLP
jgi:allophanate hydrolase subunit 2